MNDDLQPESNEWVRPVSLAVTITLGVWCFFGWVQDKGWTASGILVAWLTLVLQVVGFNASAQMRRAGRKGLVVASRYWKYVLFITAAWTAFSAHHGYVILAGPQDRLEWSVSGVLAFLEGSAALVILVCVATFEPLLGWGIEAVERGNGQPSVAQKPENVVDLPRSQPGLGRDIGRTVAGAALAATVLAGSGQGAAPVSQQPTPRVADAPPRWSMESLTLVERVKLAAAEGLSERRIVMAIGRGLTRHEVREILGRNPKRAMA